MSLYVSMIKLIPSVKGNCISILQTVVSTEAVVEMGMGMVVMPSVKVTEEFVCECPFAVCG